MVARWHTSPLLVILMFPQKADTEINDDFDKHIALTGTTTSMTIDTKPSLDTLFKKETH